MFLQDHIPVDSSEPGMTHQFDPILRAATDSLIRLSNEDLLKDVQALRGEADIIRDADVALSDVLEQLLLVSVLQDKRWLSRQHLVDDTSDTPPVDSEPMSLPIHNLRCQVFGCAA